MDGGDRTCRTLPPSPAPFSGYRFFSLGFRPLYPVASVFILAVHSSNPVSVLLSRNESASLPKRIALTLIFYLVIFFQTLKLC